MCEESKEKESNKKEGGRQGQGQDHETLTSIILRGETHEILSRGVIRTCLGPEKIPWLLCREDCRGHSRHRRPLGFLLRTWRLDQGDREGRCREMIRSEEGRKVLLTD